jgi:hypothetical protein
MPNLSDKVVEAIWLNAYSFAVNSTYKYLFVTAKYVGMEKPKPHLNDTLVRPVGMTNAKLHYEFIPGNVKTAVPGANIIVLKKIRGMIVRNNLKSAEELQALVEEKQRVKAQGA